MSRNTKLSKSKFASYKASFPVEPNPAVNGRMSKADLIKEYKKPLSMPKYRKPRPSLPNIPNVHGELPGVSNILVQHMANVSNILMPLNLKKPESKQLRNTQSTY